MSYYGVVPQTAVAQYIQNIQTSNLGGGSYMGSGSGTYQSYPASGYPTTSTITTYPTHIVTSGQTFYGNLASPGHQHNQMLPPPSGQMVSIAFTDMNGRAWSIDIDAAYLQILQAISAQHQSIFQYQPNRVVPSSPPTIKMLEGDFSEDEMSQAEQIIQEMGNGSQKQPCQCEA